MVSGAAGSARAGSTGASGPDGAATGTVAARAEPAEPERLALAAEFPAVGRDDWLDEVDKVLRRTGRIGADAPRGAGFDALVRPTLDGIPVGPLYTADDIAGEAAPARTGVPGAAPFVRGSRARGPVPDGWDVRQRHAHPDPGAARAAVLADLENGATSVWLAVGEGGTAVADLATVLDGVHLDLAPVVLDAPDAPTATAAAEAFLALAAQRGVAPDALLGSLGLDPVGVRARTGSGPGPDSVVALAERVAGEHPKLRAIVVDALPVAGAGGSDAQELGFSLAAGVAYLRALVDGGIAPDRAAELLEFRYAATVEQFPTIAKLRAARRLWSRVLQASGIDQPRGQFQHAVAAATALSRRDPYVNLLRGTVACVAAGVGGADAVTVAPFDAAIGAATPFSRRIARNTQSLLVEESHLARVLDPAGGSWLVESLTDSLARAGWAFFQELEAAGGVVPALDSGLLAERVSTIRAKREAAAATRRAPITGVSEFPDLAEKPVEREPLPPAPGGGLPVYRPAAAFEERRDRSDAALAATGARPRAFLATLGPLSAYAVRAGFARNLLAAGGVEAVEAGPTTGPDEVVAEFAAAGTPVAVLCSTDALYAERAAETAAALREAGAGLILLAGAADVPGVDGRLKAGGDALATIDAVYAAIDASSGTATGTTADRALEES
ncbi:methylmalonyl-CoA mutase family protein [Pseudonocardia humida]|uniref:methylmalonyl-CoA mutase n=1 Tax=Pseudonocardia humida TaxID=2800819 RepID=A0ABT1A6R2_9PSEU|nr:methylmalonyl-CoA mutase family protein [Pseudonocardia humida]MCO1658708.1 methylmalonyl-CoA mutase small subunit [Pseudonocardia humida]